MKYVKFNNLTNFSTIYAPYISYIFSE